MRVGLTGGVASGKSTVSAILEELGAVIIDADVLAREVVAQGSSGLEQVIAEFGEELLTPEGDLDRAALGRIVFSDEAARRRLEAITHPLIFERYAELEAAAPPDALVVHDIPLLAESGRADTFDAVVVVDVPPEVRIQLGDLVTGKVAMRASAQRGDYYRVAYDTNNGTPHLTALELRLLSTLLERRGRVQSRPALLDDVWGMSGEVTTRTVDTHVKRLREKLGGAGPYIETVRGVGYRFTPAPDHASVVGVNDDDQGP